MSTPYDSANIFGKILRGEMPCVRVHEDEHSFAFMDIMPRADGHTLIIPKVSARNLLDISDPDLARFMPAVGRIARAVKSGMGAEGVTLQQFNESAGGQVVFHLHFHVLPRWAGVSLRPHSGKMEEREKLEAHASRIRAALA